MSCPDFRSLALGFGLPYARIESSAGLAERLSEVIEGEGPVLCEVFGVLDQEYIEVSVARSAKRRFVQRPLEDQAPFLERELFLAEMLVEPIDQ